MTPTSGEWEFRTASNGDCGIAVPGSTGVFIECFADIRKADENAYEEAEANARLICVAKPMLALLEKIAGDSQGWDLRDILREADILIKKAKGV